MTLQFEGNEFQKINAQQGKSHPSTLKISTTRIHWKLHLNRFGQWAVCDGHHAIKKTKLLKKHQLDEIFSDFEEQGDSADDEKPFTDFIMDIIYGALS